MKSLAVSVLLIPALAITALAQYRNLSEHPAIYSESFDALPPPVKDYVYRGMREILDGGDAQPDFAHLTAADRTAIREILVDTKPDALESSNP